MLKNCYFCTSRCKYMCEFNTDWTCTEYSKRFVWLLRKFITEEAFTSKIARLLKSRYIWYITIATSTKDNCRCCNFYNARTIVKMNVHHFVRYEACGTTIYVYIVIGIVVVVNASGFVDFKPCTFGYSIPVHSSRININTDFFEFLYFLDRIGCCNHNFCRNTTAS